LWLFIVLAPSSAFSQQSYGSRGLRCQSDKNLVTYKTADTNVVIGYAVWRNENPRATISAQEPVAPTGR